MPLLPLIRHLGMQAYEPIWQQMKSFIDNRTAATPDEIWLLEHYPVFTQGQAGKPEHILNPGDIPIVQTDRGGQVTYHGPGQLVAYILVDLKRLQIGTRQLVCSLESAVIQVLSGYQIEARGDRAAPGIYVGNDKICSIGLRVRKNCSYHGLALNIDMDLAPFARINPCGYQGLHMTQLRDFVSGVDKVTIAAQLTKALQHELYEQPQSQTTCS